MKQIRRLAVGAPYVILFACVGCDGPWDFGTRAPSVRNASEFELSFAIRSYDEELECDAATNGEDLDPEGFSALELVRLKGGDWASLRSSQEYASDCGGALVVGDGFTTLLVTWDLRGLDVEGYEVGSEEVPPGRLYMERFGSEIRPTPGEGIFLFEWPGPEPL